MEKRREDNLETLMAMPATSIKGMRAKSAAMQIKTLADDHERCGDIGQSLAEDVLGDALAKFEKESVEILAADIWEDVLHLIGLGNIVGRIADSFPSEDENRLFYTLATQITAHAKAIEKRLDSVQEFVSAQAA